jgi:type I restriction enzyme S subunit
VKPWPTARLGEVLRHRKEFITIDDLTTYRRPRVQLHVQGIVQRDEVPGALIKTKMQQVCRAGEFLVAEIDAKVGGFGIVPESLDGSIVSSHYFLFIVDESKLDRRFLDFFIRTPAFREQVAAQGSTNYAAIRPAHVLGYEIPLPPLVEQRRVVARIEELAGEIHEARNLRHQAAEEAEVFVLAALKHLRLPRGTVDKPIHACSSMSTGTTPSSDRSDYYGGPIQWYTPGDLEYQRQLGASSRTLSEVALTERKVRMFEPGTVLLVAIGGSLGKIALAHERCSANQQITGIKFSDEVLPEYGFWWMRRLGKDLMAAAPQATLPIINQERIGAFEISIPPLPEQRRIVFELDALQAEVDALKLLQAETAAELDALLPSILDKAFRGEY